MPLLHQLLEHELHRAKNGIVAIPLMLETPAKKDFVPAIVSSSHPGKFLTVEKLTKDNRIRSGVFSYDPDRIDDIVENLFECAYSLSVSKKYPNVFKSAKSAFDYIKDSAGTLAHPHILLVPHDWDDKTITKLLGKEHLEHSKGSGFTYRGFCKILHAKIRRPVFFSRPDYVGMYTQFLGGNCSIILHNVKNGLSFVMSDN